MVPPAPIVGIRILGTPPITAAHYTSSPLIGRRDRRIFLLAAAVAGVTFLLGIAVGTVRVVVTPFVAAIFDISCTKRISR